MMNLVRAEWVKTFSLRMWWILLIIGAVLVSLYTLPFLLLSGAAAEEGIVELDTAQPEVVHSLLGAVGGASVIALLFGVLAVTGEYRHGTITDTFLTEPRRSRVVVAKCAVTTVDAALLVATTTATVGILMLLLLPDGHAPIAPAAVASAVGGELLVYALYAALGVALGALITNQIAAVVVGILWVLVLESLIGGLIPAVARWLPGGAAQAIVSSGSPDLLPPAAGALVLLGYVVALGLIAVRTTLRHDIT